ncbi:MAG TPA: CRTAC1 family protein [Planctomycetota bacterium]
MQLRIALGGSLRGGPSLRFPVAPALLGAALFGLAGAAGAQGPPAFQDATAGANFTFVHTLDPGAAVNPMVAGGAVGDFDRDGWPDVFLLGGGGRPDALFMNQRDGTFLDLAAAWGVDVLHHGAGASVADFDGDGWLDIFVTSHGLAGQPKATGLHRLYRNTGAGAFVEMAAAAGVNSTTSGAPDGYSSGWGDYDLDGDLDLFVSGWELGNDGNRLFRNDGGTFTDVTVAAGVADSQVKGFVPSFVDLDGDLWPELVHIADVGTSRYFVNDGDGTFTKLSPRPDRFSSLNGMGCAFGDFDNDGRLDFYATSIYWGPGSGNALYRNLGANSFEERAEAAGVDDGGWGWGTLALDCDNDGWLDILETNGWPDAMFGQVPTRVFHNQKNGNFVESAAAAGVTQDWQGRTLLRLDYDRDGREDFIVLSNRGPAVLYRNVSPPAHWLRLRFDTAAHPGLAPDGLGVQVTVRDGVSRSVRVLDGGPSYLGTSERVLHFGTADRTQLDEVEVRWPDGSYTFFEDVDTDRELQVKSGLPLRADPLQRGANATVSAAGFAPGEWVLLVYTPSGVGPGACRPPLGGLCFDLRAPVRFLGAANADPAGAVAATIAIPASAPLVEVGIQAVAPRGLNGTQSVKTNSLSRTILP